MRRIILHTDWLERHNAANKQAVADEVSQCGDIDNPWLMELLANNLTKFRLDEDGDIVFRASDYGIDDDDWFNRGGDDSFLQSCAAKQIIE